MGERKDLSGIGEGNRALAGGVKGAEQVDEEGDKTEMRRALFGDVVRHAGGEQRPEHIWEREEQEAAATKGIDGPDGGPGEHKVDKTETEGCNQCLLLPEATLTEDGGGVEGDDVNCRGQSCSGTFKKILVLTATHLLSNHDDTGCLGRTADTRNGEEFNKTCEEAAVRAYAERTNELLLLGQECMGIVEVASSLDRVVSQTEERLIGLGVPLLAHQPPRRLWAEIDAETERNSRNKGRTKLEAPGDFAGVLKRAG